MEVAEVIKGAAVLPRLGTSPGRLAEARPAPPIGVIAMRIIVLILVLAASGGCTGATRRMQSSAPASPGVTLRQSAVTRKIEADRVDMAKTRVEGQIVR